LVNTLRRSSTLAATRTASRKRRRTLSTMISTESTPTLSTMLSPATVSSTVSPQMSISTALPVLPITARTTLFYQMGFGTSSTLASLGLGSLAPTLSLLVWELTAALLATI
ncbi:hypothetical protein EC988_006484, partial [Linderina pennispora]